MNNGKILLVESDESLRNTRTQLLSKEGYIVSGTASIEVAAKVAQQESFDLLILNVDNPNLLSLLLAQFPPRMSVLLLSDKNIAGELVENANGDLHNCLFLPFSSVQFKNAIANTINRSRQIKEIIRNEVLTDLGSLNHKLSMGTEINKFMDTVTHLSSVTTSADYVSLLVYGNRPDEPLIKSETGEPDLRWDEMLKKLRRYEEPVILHDDSQCGNGLVKSMNESGISSILYLPIIVNDNILGSITQIKTPGSMKFGEVDFRFVSILAWLSGMTLENTKVNLDYYKEHVHADRLLDHISYAQENERKRVAIDIHDGVAQWLVGASYDIKLCSRLVAESNYPEVESTLEKVRNVLQNSLKELRRSISNLPLPPLEDIGLVGVIHKLVDKVEEEGIDCDLIIPDELPDISLAQEKTFYWFIQESLTNIRKHSQATRVTIKMEYVDNCVSICITDNGIGFDLDQVMKSGVFLEHIGLLGMKERADYLNGNFDIESKPGTGTCVNLSFSLIPPEIVSLVRT
ncbi:MAG: hypothetical protein JSU58_04840 [Dehalococcoidales bacterium]|nr:MAG: hypothetical protein JSU58_04840 [Dehalococcoidales bacterium]